VGEAGIGKTRLLYEFERQIDKEHLTFISARCQPSDIHTPLLPFVQALNDLLGQSDGTARLGTEEEVLSRLEDIDADLELYLPLYLHLLSIRSDTHSIPKHLKDNGLRLAILEALSAIFTASSRSRPLVLLLEDWHWSDQGSRDALDQLIALIPAYRVMTVATSRPEYAFSVSSNHTPLRLRPLDSDESFELAKLLLIGAPFSDVQRKSFYNRTGGNPFFLEELCRATREGVDAAVENGAPRADDQADVPLPFTVRSAIQARLQTLTDNDLRILRVAAVIGYEFGHRVLRQVAANDEVRLQASMERLRVAGHIHKMGVLPEATYRFAHVLVQEAIHDSLLDHQRRTLHKRIGEAIESLIAGHVEEHAERLSLHFRLAEDWPNAIRYARIAIDKSWAISQFAEVLAMLEITEHAARLLPHAEANQEVLIEALLRQERVCETLGRKERQEALIAELISLLEPKGVSARLADVYTRRGDLHNLLGQFEAGEADLDKALRMSREVSDASLESRVLRSMGFLFYRGNQLHKALTCAEEVVMRDRRHGSPRMLLHDLISLSSILNSLGENQSALKFAREAASLAETHDFGDELANTSYVIAEIYRRMGETDQALDYLHEALEHSPYRHGTPLGSLRKPAVIFAAMANIYLEQGDTEESLRHCQDAVDWGRKSMAAEELVMSLRQLGMLLMMLDRPGEAAPHLQEACNLYARMGDLEGEVVMQRALALVFAMRRAAGVLALQRRRQDALGELEALEALGRLNRSKSGPATVSLRYYRQALTLAKGLDSRERQSNLHNTLGILEWQQGSYEAALSHYQDALRICEEAGDDVHAGLMLNSIGVTLHRLGRLSEAQAVLERALELHRSSERQLLEGHALAAIGDVLYDQEKFELATRLYEMSLEIRRNLNDRTGEAWMLHHLARAHHASGERDAARQRLDGASAIAREDNVAELSEACLLVSNSWVREEI
jgi:tetratricopeptide (TPR) repeat protein